MRKITICWDDQDPNNEGWAWRMFDSGGWDSGPLSHPDDLPREASLEAIRSTFEREVTWFDDEDLVEILR